MQPCNFHGGAVEVMAKVSKMAKQNTLQRADMLARRRFREFRHEFARQSEGLSQPAPATPVREIEMQPNRALFRPNWRDQLNFGQLLPAAICVEVIGADEAGHGNGGHWN